MNLDQLDEQVLTVPQAAEILRVSERTYYEGIARGTLPGLRIGERRLVVPGVQLRRLLEGGAGERA